MAHACVPSMYDGALIAVPNHQESRPTWSGLPVMNGTS